MKLWVRSIAAAAAGILMVGCGASAENSSSVQDRDISAEEVLSQVGGGILDGSAYMGDGVFEENCEKFYGADRQDITDGGILYSSEGGYADEVSMIKTAEPELGESLLKERVSSRRTVFENYKPEETAKIDDAEIFSAGGYWVLVISDDSDEISDEIRELVGE